MKRCRKLEEIMEKIKLEFPGVELHQDKSTIYFKVSNSIQVYVTIKEWKLYNLWIISGSPKMPRQMNLTVTNIEDIRYYVNIVMAPLNTNNNDIQRLSNEEIVAC